MKSPLVWLLYLLGVTRFAGWWHRKDLVILNYHGIGEDDRRAAPGNPLDLTVSLGNFQRQIAYLRRRHNVVSLREFLSAHVEGRRLPDYSVVLTFDDGYRDFLSVAPLLLKHNLPATLFLVTDMVRPEEVGKEPTPDQADRLSWNEVQTLDRHDIFEFGSHTCSHPSLNTLTPELIEHELRVSLNEICGKVTNVTPALAYPNGAYAGLSIEEISGAGYSCGLTIDPGANKLGTNPFWLHRQTIRGQDNQQMFAARVSCLTSWLYLMREKALACCQVFLQGWPGLN
jgi:peptidoglycan/xylan/chitin deacetylase (PgdA/CDA1 family)